MYYPGSSTSSTRLNHSQPMPCHSGADNNYTFGTVDGNAYLKCHFNGGNKNRAGKLKRGRCYFSPTDCSQPVNAISEAICAENSDYLPPSEGNGHHRPPAICSPILTSSPGSSISSSSGNHTSNGGGRVNASFVMPSVLGKSHESFGSSSSTLGNRYGAGAGTNMIIGLSGNENPLDLQEYVPCSAARKGSETSNTREPMLWSKTEPNGESKNSSCNSSNGSDRLLGESLMSKEVEESNYVCNNKGSLISPSSTTANNAGDSSSDLKGNKISSGLVERNGTTAAVTDNGY